MIRWPVTLSTRISTQCRVGDRVVQGSRRGAQRRGSMRSTAARCRAAGRARRHQPGGLVSRHRLPRHFNLEQLANGVLRIAKPRLPIEQGVQCRTSVSPTVAATSMGLSMEMTNHSTKHNRRAATPPVCSIASARLACVSLAHPPASAQDVSAGGRRFQQRCVACHAMQAVTDPLQMCFHPRQEHSRLALAAATRQAFRHGLST